MIKKQSYYKNLLNYSLDYILIFDEDLNILDQSNNFFADENKKVNSNFSFLDFFPKNDYTSIKEMIENISNNHKSTQFENLFLLEKKVINAEIKIALIEGLDNKLFIAVIKDISREKKYKTDLQTEKMFMFNLMNQIPDSIYIKDTESRFLRINKTQANTLGVKSPIEALGKSDKDFFTNEHAIQAFIDEKEIVTRKVDFIRKEELIRHSSGEFLWVSTIKVPLIDREDNIVGTLGITRNITDIKQIELDLRRSESLFKSIWNNSLDGMRILDDKGKIFMANPSFCLMFGLEENELIGKSISVMFHKSAEEINNKKLGQQRLNELIKKINDRKVIPNLEKELHLWNGMHVWFEITNSYLEIEGKNYLLSVFRDINERKIYESKIEYSEKLSKTTINSISDFLFVIDLNKKVILSNNSFTEFIKKNEIDNDIIGMDLEELLQLLPFLAESFYDLVLSTKQELIIFDSFDLVSKHFFFEIKFIPVIDNNFVNRIITLILDITDLKRYEEELRRSALIFENLNDSVFIIDRQGNFVDLNVSAEKMYGFKRGDILKKSLDFLIDAGLDIPSGNKLINILSTSSKWSSKVWFTNNINKTKRHINIEFLPLTDSKGDTIAFFSVAKDITDLTIAQEKINNYIAELQTKKTELENTGEELRLTNTSKDKFFSIIAHDLKSPFQGILGFYNILKDEYDTLEKDEIKFMVTNMGESAKNLYALIENLLEWSRVQLGKIECIKEIFDLNLLIYSVKSMLNGNLIKKSISVVIESKDDISIYADRKMINSVLSNLLSNSIKFTNKGGKITISTEVKKKFAKISIIDNGIGMDNKTLKALFKIDSNVSRNGTENEKGTGLGLILCKEFIERNGGKINVKSKINEGSIFTFTIPLAQ
ncbi:MAG: PAS domain-containing sensor histidine kinase [bacterium]